RGAHGGGLVRLSAAEAFAPPRQDNENSQNQHCYKIGFQGLESFHRTSFRKFLDSRLFMLHLSYVPTSFPIALKAFGYLRSPIQKLTPRSQALAWERNAL